MARQLSHKPGAEKARFRPDIILDFNVTAEQFDQLSALPKAVEGEPTPTEPELGLLAYLYAMMPDRKRVTVKDYLKHNQVMVNGRVTTQFNTPLQPGDRVSVNTSREFQLLRHPRLKLVYEDDDVIVVDKGYGLPSIAPENGHGVETAYSIVRDYLKRLNPKNKLFVVHRLDQHTSGLMMFAKSAQAKDNMQHNWNNMVLERRYVAVVEGRPDPAEGKVESLLAENSQHVVYSTEDAKLGKPALTRYKTLGTSNGYSLVELNLSTGRKNQIRVHMHDLGTPIAGDRKYGAKSSPLHRVALHAMTLRFAHPITRRDMNFSCPPPAGFTKLTGTRLK